MENYSGFIVVLDEARRAWNLELQLDDTAGGAFSDAFSAADWKFKKLEVCLLSLDGTHFTHLALAKRGARVVTGKYRINFFDVQPLEPNTSFDNIEKFMPDRFRRYFVKTSSGQGGRVPPQTWKQLKIALTASHKDLGDQIEDFERKRIELEEPYRGEHVEVVAQERDACFLAMDIFGLEKKHRRDLVMDSEESSSHDEVVPFLEGLSSTIIREDQMIDHDTTIFGDWEFIKSVQVGMKIFRRHGQQLSIMNLNRTPVESVLGVDLLYYHHRYNSYLLVQYKRMTQDSSESMSCFRPNNNSYEKEFSAMKGIDQQFAKSYTLLEQYRLNFGAFYFKLCNAEIFTPSDTDLIKGMYIPLDYWESLLAGGQAVGPQGGAVISKQNVGRYLNNTMFVELAQHGWIGSAAVDSALITSLIQSLLEAKHSVFLANSESYES